MPALTDECVLNIDGLLSFDPAASLRQRAQQFVSSRSWSTKEVFYGDQAEPADEDTDTGPQEPLWSFCFCLGLDHILAGKGDWRGDIGSLVDFVQQVYVETGQEILVEVRYRSKPWYSDHITYVDDSTADLGTICSMVERVVKRPAKPWWRFW